MATLLTPAQARPAQQFLSDRSVSPSIRPECQMRRVTAAKFLLAAAAMLSGCGGGAGSSDFGATAISPAQVTIPDSALIQKSDLVYVGAFRVPQGSSDTTTFNYGGTALGLGQGGKSLFMTGHDWHQRSAEISIPEVINNPNLTGLATATLLQSFGDPTEGKLGQINPSDPNSKKVGGHLVYNGSLYVTGWSYYDGAGTQSASHFRRPLSLSSSGQVVGPVRVGSQYPGYVHGFMTTIPPEWQSAFGGPALTGHGGASIASIQSNGPAASVFDPARIGTVSPVPATPVVGYPLAQSLARRYGANETGAANAYWLATDSVDGAAFPVGTRSVLFFGRHGQGAYCYGTGGTSGDCYDPADNSKGSHSYPYAYQVWAYDANDLLAVKAGSKAQYEVLPYAVWTFDLPYTGNSSARRLGGVAYDPATGRIYIAQRCEDTNCAPVVHVM
ncbi:MAG: hypothetical protein IT185_06055, partial [Acidobacteria bacterium]|nr:hypothetical protein [Acidobacteriota bacterium]